MNDVATAPRGTRDPAKVRRWAISRHRKLIAERRCTNCGKDLPPSCATKRCPPCSQLGRQGASKADRVARFLADLARVVETAALSTAEQARQLGMTRDRVAYLRCKARARGHAVPLERPSDRGSRPSEKWAAIDAATPCRVCTLRGEHVCLPALNPLASGPGWL